MIYGIIDDWTMAGLTILGIIILTLVYFCSTPKSSTCKKGTYEYITSQKLVPVIRYQTTDNIHIDTLYIYELKR